MRTAKQASPAQKGILAYFGSPVAGNRSPSSKKRSSPSLTSPNEPISASPVVPTSTVATSAPAEPARKRLRMPGDDDADGIASSVVAAEVVGDRDAVERHNVAATDAVEEQPSATATDGAGKELSATAANAVDEKPSATAADAVDTAAEDVQMAETSDAEARAEPASEIVQSRDEVVAVAEETVDTGVVAPAIQVDDDAEAAVSVPSAPSSVSGDADMDGDDDAAVEARAGVCSARQAIAAAREAMKLVLEGEGAKSACEDVRALLRDDAQVSGDLQALGAPAKDDGNSDGKVVESDAVVLQRAVAVLVQDCDDGDRSAVVASLAHEVQRPADAVESALLMVAKPVSYVSGDSRLAIPALIRWEVGDLRLLPKWARKPVRERKAARSRYGRAVAERVRELVKAEKKLDAEMRKARREVTAERRRAEKEADAERKRAEKEAEAERKRAEKEAEAERKRAEKEAEAERRKAEKEAEAERKRAEKEAEAEKKRQEAERRKAEELRAREEEEERQRKEQEAQRRRNRSFMTKFFQDPEAAGSGSTSSNEGAASIAAAGGASAAAATVCGDECAPVVRGVNGLFARAPLLTAGSGWLAPALVRQRQHRAAATSSPTLTACDCDGTQAASREERAALTTWARAHPCTRRRSRPTTIAVPGYTPAVYVSTRLKLLHFHDQLRPPYRGTCSLSPTAVRPASARNPVERVPESLGVIDYDSFSEYDWDDDDNAADAEDLDADSVGSDAEDRDVENLDSDDNDNDAFVVPDGYFSASEGEDDVDAAAAALSAESESDDDMADADPDDPTSPPPKKKGRKDKRNRLRMGGRHLRTSAELLRDSALIRGGRFDPLVPFFCTTMESGDRVSEDERAYHRDLLASFAIVPMECKAPPVADIERSPVAAQPPKEPDVEVDRALARVLHGATSKAKTIINSFCEIHPDLKRVWVKNRMRQMSSYDGRRHLYVVHKDVLDSLGVADDAGLHTAPPPPPPAAMDDNPTPPQNSADPSTATSSEGIRSFFSSAPAPPQFDDRNQERWSEELAAALTSGESKETECARIVGEIAAAMAAMDTIPPAVLEAVRPAFVDSLLRVLSLSGGIDADVARKVVDAVNKLVKEFKQHRFVAALARTGAADGASDTSLCPPWMTAVVASPTLAAYIQAELSSNVLARMKPVLRLLYTVCAITAPTEPPAAFRRLQDAINASMLPLVTCTSALHGICSSLRSSNRQLPGLAIVVLDAIFALRGVAESDSDRDFILAAVLDALTAAASSSKVPRVVVRYGLSLAVALLPRVARPDSKVVEIAIAFLRSMTADPPSPLAVHIRSDPLLLSKLHNLLHIVMATYASHEGGRPSVIDDIARALPSATKT